MIETALKDATRKAKSKLQREWSNFKEGYVCYVSHNSLYLIFIKISHKNLIHTYAHTYRQLEKLFIKIIRENFTYRNHRIEN